MPPIPQILRTGPGGGPHVSDGGGLTGKWSGWEAKTCPVLFRRRRGAEVALFGHSHIPHAEQRGKVFLFNPGSCGRCYTGPDTYGLLTLENGKVTAYEHKEVPKQ